MEKYPLKEELSVFTSGWSSVAFLGPVRRKNSMKLNARHYLWRRTSYWRFEDHDPENAAGYEAKAQPIQLSFKFSSGATYNYIASLYPNLPTRKCLSQLSLLYL